MAYPLEDDFTEWSKPPTATEEQRCTNAVSVVRNAIRPCSAFASRNIEVFAQGSYHNGTNVRANSDVDVCVRCTDVCFTELPAGYTNSDVGLVDASYTYAEFKNDVEHALKSYLGASAVSRGKKAIDLHANTYRVDADVVPTFEHRRYSVSNGIKRYLSGTELHPDNGGRIVNWPHQNYENGTSKNNATGTRFKKLVRVLKRLRDEMVAEGNAAARSRFLRTSSSAWCGMHRTTRSSTTSTPRTCERSCSTSTRTRRPTLGATSGAKSTS